MQEGGSNMQDGSVTVERRKRGPDVWCFRWREGGPDGRRIHRRIVLGTADDLKGIASARKAFVGLRHEINVNDIRVRRESITLGDLSRHFQQRELVRDIRRQLSRSCSEKKNRRRKLCLEKIYFLYLFCAFLCPRKNGAVSLSS